MTFVRLLDGIPAILYERCPRRRRPGKLHADKGYDAEDLRTECRRRGIAPRVARRGIVSSERLGRWRWKVERTLSWAIRYRRLSSRYERSARRFAVFLSLAATLVCFNDSPNSPNETPSKTVSHVVSFASRLKQVRVAARERNAAK